MKDTPGHKAPKTLNRSDVGHRPVLDQHGPLGVVDGIQQTNNKQRATWSGLSGIKGVDG